MDEVITDQELRRRLLVFNPVVPPITSSTRKLLQRKLVNLESGQQAGKINDASKSMPPPKPKTKAPPTNGTNDSVLISSSKQSQHMKFDNTESPRKSTRQRRYRAPDPFDTSDSEVDTGSLGRSILPTNPYIASSSPKSSERSLMNVSDWKSAATTDEEQIPYASSPVERHLTKTRKSPSRQSEKQTEKLAPRFVDSNKTPTESSVNRKLRSSPISKTSSHADQAIQRWKEKLMTESQNKNDALNPALFNSPSIPKKSSEYLRKNIHSVQNDRNPFKKKKYSEYLFLTVFYWIFWNNFWVVLHFNTVEYSGITSRYFEFIMCKKTSSRVQL